MGAAVFFNCRKLLSAGYTPRQPFPQPLAVYLRPRPCMKQYTVTVARFALVPMISGPFVVSMRGTANAFEIAHAAAGIAAIYLILILLLKAVKNRRIRVQAAIALLLGLLEAIPGLPRAHAVVSPILFATLVWAVVSLPDGQHSAPSRGRAIFALPALVLLPILYGVGYRHQTSGFLPHIGAALLVAGFLVMFSMLLKERRPADGNLRRACNLTITAVIVQIVLGIAAFVIRLLEIENGLLLQAVRTLHITGAAPVLAATTELAIQYRRNAAGALVVT